MNSYDEYTIPMTTTNMNLQTQLSTQKTIRGHRRVCVVCGAKALGINFHSLTCTSCKAFFRRNGTRPLTDFTCRLFGECLISEKTRRQCAACRIRKCFEMGMMKQYIRTLEENQQHQALVEKNRREISAKFSSQQTHQLIGNRRFQQNDSLVLFPDVEKNLGQCCHRFSRARSNHSIDHINILHELFVESAKDILADNFIFEFNADITEVLNLHCLPISSLITFVKQLSYFQCLPVDDKIILLKNNTRCLLPLLVYLFHHIFDVSILVLHPGHDHLNDDLAITYTLLTDSIYPDSKLILLCTIVLLFCPCLLTMYSSNNIDQMTDQSRQRIQYVYDNYAHMLWEYLLKRSRDHEHQATVTLMKLISIFVRLLQLTSDIYDRIQCFVPIDRLHLMIQSILNFT